MLTLTKAIYSMSLTVLELASDSYSLGEVTKDKAGIEAETKSLTSQN